MKITINNNLDQWKWCNRTC